MTDFFSGWQHSPLADDLRLLICWSALEPNFDGTLDDALDDDPDATLNVDLAVIDVAFGDDTAQTLKARHAADAPVADKSLQVIDLDRLARLDQQGETIALVADMQLCVE